MASTEIGPKAEVVEMANTNKDVQLSFLEKLVVGGAAGVIGTTAIFPIDTVKTRLMAQKPFPDGTLPYTGPIDCVRKLFRNGGFAEFYNGLRPNLIGVTPEKAIKLAVNDWMRDRFAAGNHVRGTLGDAGGGLFMWQAIVSGSTAGFCQVVATNPMEMVKLRMQLLAETPGAASTTMVEVVKGLGLTGMYRGSAATLLRDVPFSAVFFPAYGVIKSMLTPKGQEQGLLGPLVAGVIAGAVGATTVTPMDVIKTRLQAKGARKLYSGVVDCATKILEKEGPAAFMRGAVPRALVVGPLFGISLLAFELFKSWRKSALRKHPTSTSRA